MQKGSAQPKGRKQQRGVRGSQGNGFSKVPLSAQSTRVVCRTLGVPKTLQCKFQIGAQGYLPIGSTASGQSLIYGNVFDGCFNTATPISAVSPGLQLGLTNGSSITKLFPGYAMMLAGYSAYRVIRSKLVVTAICGNSGDTMNVWIQPIPLALSAATQYEAAVGNAGTVAAMISAGCRPIRLESDVNPWDVLGYTRAEYQAAGFAIGAIAGIPAGSQTTAWQVSYATMDGAVTAGQNYFDFQVEYEVEFFNPYPQQA